MVCVQFSPVGFATKFCQRTFNSVQLIVFLVSHFVNLTTRDVLSGYVYRGHSSLLQRTNHGRDIPDVRSIRPSRSMSSFWCRMDFPTLDAIVFRRSGRTRRDEYVPTPNVFELTETALAIRAAAGVKYRKTRQETGLGGWWMAAPRRLACRRSKCVCEYASEVIISLFCWRTREMNCWMYVPARRSAPFPLSSLTHVVKSSKQNLKSKTLSRIHTGQRRGKPTSV